MPSANDNIANAINLGSLAYGEYSQSAIDTTTNTTESGEPNSSGSGLRSAWWTFTPAASGAIRWRRGTGTTGYGTLYSGAPGLTSPATGLTAMHGNLVAASTSFSDALPVTAGVTYYLQMGYANHASQQYIFDLGARPANDNFADAIVLSGVVNGGPQTATAVDIRYATVDPGDSDASVWYRVTPDADGTLDLVNGNTYVSYRIYTGSALGSLTNVASDLVQAGSSVHSGAVRLQAGVTYQIRMTVASNPSPGYAPTFEVGTAPANDLFAGRTTLDMSSGSAVIAYDNKLCTAAESGEPGASVAGQRSRWWSYTPLTSGTLTLTKTNAVGTLYSSLHTGSAVNALTGVKTQQFGNWSQAVTGGVTYQLQIGYQRGTATYTLAGPASAAVASPQTIALNRAATTSSAQPVAVVTTGPAQTISLGQTDTPHTAHPLALQTAINLGLASAQEAEVARACGPLISGVDITCARAEETTQATAMGVGVVSHLDVPLGHAESTETATATTVGSQIDVAFGQAIDTHLATSLVPGRGVPLGVALEADAAINLLAPATIALGTAEETSTAHPVGVTAVEALGRAEDGTTALPILGVVAAPPLHTTFTADTARALTVRRDLATVAVGTALEVTTTFALPFTVTHRVALGTAEDLEAAHKVRVQRALADNQDVVDTGTAGNVGAIKKRARPASQLPGTRFFYV